MKIANLGFPRIGRQRELKRAVERYWQRELTEEQLQTEAKQMRKAAWTLQQECGCDIIPVNDFSFYDHVLDTTAMVGAVPARFGQVGTTVDLATYFAMARGRDGVPAMEMTKWFDTNYHYIVPEFHSGQTFRLASTKIVDEFLEAKQQGVPARPVLLGPVSYLLLGKTESQHDQLSLLDALLPVYLEVLSRLVDAGATWVQIDEPALVTDLSAEVAAAFQNAYRYLAEAKLPVKVMLTTYFGSLDDNLALAASLPVHGLHVDLVRGADQLDDVLTHWPEDRWLSLGVIDGRNVWRSDLDAVLRLIRQAIRRRESERLILAPSCSLLHVPYDLEAESNLDHELRSWLAFAKQKLQELSLLSRAVHEGESAVSAELNAARQSFKQRASSARVRREHVRRRCASLSPDDAKRLAPYPVRREKQQAALGLPLFPTTTIGSFPQTPEIRKARAEHRAGRISAAEYEQFLKQEIARVIEAQEEIGLDVLVHGEPERNDMVEYFGEHLEGFAFTQNGWVQSYGTRCVKPPIIFGDVERRDPITVRWSKYAQSLTPRIMKGMLTGPVTILQWSFVRDDQPRSETCRQIALALRDEVADLEQAGIRVIQIDEPALREGLPLRPAQWQKYLAWATECFRLAASAVADETQIHTHMCYAEFNDILPAIAALDADVISIESSRSKMELLEAFREHSYPNEIGPGVYDIHSPRIPTQDEITALLHAACEVLSVEQLWVNPDCGLKTRRWPEVKAALQNMVAAAEQLRREHISRQQ